MRHATHPIPSFLVVLAIAWTAAAAALPAAGPNPPPNPAIAFVESGAVKVMNADGSNVRTLVSRAGAREPAWSPDSSQIVFWGTPGGICGLHAVPLAGGATRLVTPAVYCDYSIPGLPDWSPVPAPDGQYKILFLDRDVSNYNDDLDVFLVNPDGSGRLNLTNSPGWTEWHGAAWAPDGRRVAFQRNGSLWVIELGLVNGELAPVDERVAYAGAPTLQLTWAKTSEKVAFKHFNLSRIMTLDLADPYAVPIAITPDTGFDERWPSFSPDDSRLVYVRGGTQGGIFVINADGTGNTRIYRGGSDPSWRRTP